MSVLGLMSDIRYCIADRSITVLRNQVKCWCLKTRS